MIRAIYYLINALLSIYWWVVLIAAVYSTLLAFGVLDSRNRIVWTIGDFLYRATEPVLRPIRNLLPDLGGIDISPLIVLVIIYAIQDYLLPAIFGAIVTGRWQSVLY